MTTFSTILEFTDFTYVFRMFKSTITLLRTSSSKIMFMAYFHFLLLTVSIIIILIYIPISLIIIIIFREIREYTLVLASIISWRGPSLVLFMRCRRRFWFIVEALILFLISFGVLGYILVVSNSILIISIVSRSRGSDRILILWMTSSRIRGNKGSFLGFFINLPSGDRRILILW